MHLYPLIYQNLFMYIELLNDLKLQINFLCFTISIIREKYSKTNIIILKIWLDYI